MEVFMSFIPKTLAYKLRVNNGGCGIVAILLSIKLKSDKFLWCARSYDNQGLSVPRHYFVKHNNKAVDIFGEKDIDALYDDFDVVKEVDPEFVLATIANRDGWNNDFNRSNTPHVAALLGVEVPEYLNQVIQEVTVDKKWFVQHKQNAYICFDTIDEMYKFVCKLKHHDGLHIWYGYHNDTPIQKNRLFDK